MHAAELFFGLLLAGFLSFYFCMLSTCKPSNLKIEMSHEQVQITPAELSFKFHPNKQLLGSIGISNGTDSRVAFKIKTTAPKKYVVRPSSGIVELKASASVQVIMGAQSEYSTDMVDCKDKFMVQTVLLKEGEDIGPDTFNKDVKKSTMREARLRVVIDPPSAVAAPLPEEPDEDELRLQELKNLKAAEQLAKCQAAVREATALKKENAALAAELQKIGSERDTLRRTLDSVQLQGAGAGQVAQQRDAAMSFRISLVHIILAAIIAFVVGHYT